MPHFVKCSTPHHIWSRSQHYCVRKLYWFHTDLVLRRPRSSGALAAARGRLAPAKAPEGRRPGPPACMVRDAAQRARLLTMRPGGSAFVTQWCKSDCKPSLWFLGPAKLVLLAPLSLPMNTATLFPVSKGIFAMTTVDVTGQLAH